MANIAELQARIAELRSVLDRVSLDRRQAEEDIQQNGVQIMRTVLDSKRRPIEKLGLNPAVSVVTATERLRRSLTRELAELNAELEEALQPPNEWEDVKKITDAAQR